MKISHIVAAAENGVIGVDNGLPWNIPEDTKFFRDKTKGHIVIMGRKTYDSMGKALPNRLNIVITRQKGYTLPDAKVVSSLEESIKLAKAELKNWPEEVFIIGGGQIYEESLPITDIVYLTRIHGDYSGSAKYPALDPKKFKEIHRLERKGTPDYTFLTYEHKKS